MDKKLTGKALAKFEAQRDVWREFLDGVWEIKAGGGKRTKIETNAATNYPAATKKLLKIAEYHPEIVSEIAA